MFRIRVLFTGLFFFLLVFIGSSQVLPSSYDSLVLWLEPTTNIIDDGFNNILSWEDATNNGLIFTTSGSESPSLTSGVAKLNGYPAVSFDGIDDVLDGGDVLDMGTSSRTFFVLTRTNSLTGTYFGKTLAVNDPNRFSFLHSSGSPLYVYQDVARVDLTVSNNTTEYNIYTITTDRQALQNKLYINSVHQGTIAISQGSSYNFDSSYRFLLGAFNSADDLSEIMNLDGDIVEFIVYDTVFASVEQNEIEQYFRYKYTPPVDLGSDIVLLPATCDTIIDAYKPWFTAYLWNNGETTQSITGLTSDKYAVTVTDIFGYISSDSINVNLGANTVGDSNLICLGDSLVWDVSLSHNSYTFLWSDLTNDSLLTINQEGQFSVTISNTCGFLSESQTYVSIDSFEVTASLGVDTILCAGNFIGLGQSTGVGSMYIWAPNNETTTQLTIDTSGTYSVTATNINNCVARDTIDVSILGYAPIAGFSADSVCLGDINTFIDLSEVNPLDPSPIVQWEWVFGDGSDTLLQNTQHLYTDDGIYSVSLEVTTAAGCAQIIIDTLVVYAIPVGEILVENGLKCSGSHVSIVGNPILYVSLWNWNFDNPGSGSDSISVLQSPTHSFTSGGNFDITAIITSNQGCVDTLNKTTTITQSPIANFMYYSSCVGEQMQFIDSTEDANNGWTWQWDFGDQNTVSGQVPNPDNSYAELGYYMVSMVVKSSEGCIDTVQKVIKVSENPIANFVVTDFCLHSPIQVSDSSTANDSIVSWSWNVINHQNASTRKDPIFNFTYDNPSTYNMQLVVTTEIGCSDSITKLITIHQQPEAYFSFTPEFGAPPLTVDFTDESVDGSTYEWSFGNGEISTNQNPTIEYDEDGTYNIQFISFSQYGCADTSFGFIKVTNPSLDMAVNKIYTAKINEDQFLEISVELINFGTREVNDFDLIASTSDGHTILEKWNGQLFTLEDSLYTFSAAFELKNGELPSTVCVVLENPNGELDDDLTNNEYCLSLTEFLVFNPYPNPANDWIYLDFILPEDGPVTIQLYNSLGKLVRNIYDGDGVKGLNRLSFLISDLSSEMFTITINYGGESEFKKFIKLNKE
ncbi:MAG: PKD domain-containing protein [Flavobacteriales bacterium]|nr:PKD domain-containing protein [Flavobacteriales bacterium]